MNIFTVLTSALLLASCGGEIVESSYPSYAAAVADGAVQRGWIPMWLSEDAVALHEVHDIDSNESLLVFELKSGSVWEPGAACSETGVGGFFGPRFRTSWLPKSMDGFRHFSCISGMPMTAGKPPLEAVLAVSPDRTHFIYWRYLSP